jgi:hypothetical protein
VNLFPPASKCSFPTRPGAPFRVAGPFFHHPVRRQPHDGRQGRQRHERPGQRLYYPVPFLDHHAFCAQADDRLPRGAHPAQIWTIIGAGAVGALAYTFTDSFWFSAVEGEVYALSSMFTALAFWSILKWERADDAAGDDRNLRNRADRWIVFLFFTLGLSIGIHLLGLLVIPAAVMVYYYKRYRYTRWGAIWAFVIGCVITGIVQVAIIQWTVKMAGRFDILFVKWISGCPSSPASPSFFILIAFLVWLGLDGPTGITGPSFASVSGAFVYDAGLFHLCDHHGKVYCEPFAGHEQCGQPDEPCLLPRPRAIWSQPILYGTHFLAQPVDLVEKGTRYAKGENNYIELPADKEYAYDSKDYQIFPRVWDPSDEQQHATFYIQWLNLGIVTARQTSIISGVGPGIIQAQDASGKTETYNLDDGYASKVQRGQMVQQGAPIAVKIPTYGDNIEWFFTYQMSFMYWRYFMWNFSGRQNDIQGSGNKRDGNWITGISFIDNMRLGDQSMLPASIKDNKATNTLFLLPFLLGVIGCVYQFIRNRKDWVVSFLLFFFTGVAIVIYLNQAGNQPRERDYAFAGSFYAYAIWIGLSVVAFARMAREKQDKLTFNNVLIYGSIATLLVSVMSGGGMASFAIAIAYAVVTALITLIVRAVSKDNIRMAGLVATALCLVAPVVMGVQEWDDHDRSRKTTGPDVARDYLEGCPQNAILFTFGDNDTYPLWYAQEVEGVRPDVRIVNTSLLGIDWYVNQLRYKVNESAPFKLLWSADQIRGLGYVTMNEQGDQTKAYDLTYILKDVMGKQSPISSFPVRRLTVPVDVEAIRKQNIMKPGDSLSSQIELDIPEGKNYLSLDQLTMLNILAANNWSRPICFTSHYSDAGFGPYLRQIGMIYQLVPFRSESRATAMDVDKTSDLLLNKFRSGGANIKGVYFDEENRRHLLFIRQTYAIAASSLADQGRKAEALKVLNKSESLIQPSQLPYAMVSRGNSHNQFSLLYLEAAYKSGDMELANKVKGALRKDLNEQKAYYKYLRENKEEFYPSFINDEQDCDQFLRYMDEWEKMYNPATLNVPEHPGTGPKAADSAHTP